MTSERDAYNYDSDLSVLTKLRREIRTSRHRLANELQDVTNSIHMLKENTNTISPVKKPSPLRKSYIPSRSSSSSRETKPSPTYYRSYEIDNEVLEKSNTRYLNTDDYERDSYLNNKKRERFLNTLKSPGIHRSQSQDASARYDKDKYQNLGFRPRGIPDLRPETKKYDLTPGVKPSKWVPSPTRKQEMYEPDLESPIRSSKLDGKKRDEIDELLNEPIYEDKKDDFSNLVTKYKLTSTKMPNQIWKDLDDRDEQLLRELRSFKSNSADSPPFNEKSTDELKKQNDRLLRELRLYRSQDNTASASPSKHRPSFELVSQNKTLLAQVEDLKRFVEFLEDQFDRLYKKSQNYKFERRALHKRNQELLFINSYYKSLLSKTGELKLKETTETTDTTTQLLLNFGTKRPSPTFKKLSSIKKFKAVSNVVIAIVRLRKRAGYSMDELTFS